MRKNMSYAVFLAVIFAGIVYFAVCSNKAYNEKLQEEKAAVEVEPKDACSEQARMYVHSWNIAAYTNGSAISFHGNVNSEGDYVFTAVNIEIDFYSEEDVVTHEVLAFRIRNEWEAITGSKLIRFIDPDGVIVIWTDKEGNFFASLPPEKEEKKPDEIKKSVLLQNV